MSRRLTFKTPVLPFSWRSYSIKFRLQASADAQFSVSGLAGFGVAVNDRIEAVLLCWMPVDIRQCIVRGRARKINTVIQIDEISLSFQRTRLQIVAHMHDLLRPPKCDYIVTSSSYEYLSGSAVFERVHL